ncbi:MAG: glycoside hydrolase family 97 protein [Acidobacteria bacterium]|nr:glycoside hydrolase family 97 protein [Acidobacteriota bacterium]MBV9625398.1 glycoside hydrolase family 97 protein [Acidobacteriota bacterium]
MKQVLIIVLLLAAPGGLSAQSSGPQSSFDLRSPDGRIELRIHAAGQIRYDLLLKGRAVMENSTLALDVEHNRLGANAKLIEAKQSSFDQVFEPVVRQKFAKIHDRHNELRLALEGGYAVVFRAYDEGVAYRLETSLPAQKVKVYGEEANFNFPSNFIVYYPQEDSFYSHNERKYLPQHLTEILPRYIATLPAVVDIGEGAKLAIAESDVDDYPGLWLHGTAPHFTLTATFPPYPLKETQTSDRDYKVVESADYIAVTSGTRTYPWRVIGIAEKDGDLITNQLVWLLERPSQVTDTSWIKPGKVAWDWWNDWNIRGVDFRAGINTDTYKYYIDFASKYGIPYIILDDGWYKLGNLLEVAPGMNMEELTAYAKQKGVGVILWTSWKTLDDQLMPALDEFARWGIKGIKVDFMQRSDQLMINYFHRVCREAAKRKMLVDFHGDQKPATMTRTWPNLINVEGVRGMEWSKWSWESEPKHNVTLPFTRMFLGPMDYTPGAMRNATKTTFAPINAQPMAMGTRCHQLAMYVVYEAPLQMLSDSPSNYLEEPQIMEFLGAVPTVWDETRVLDARIADYVLLARKNGNDWYTGALTDWTARDLEVDFSFLPEGNFVSEAYQDGINADRDAKDYKKISTPVNRTTKLKIHLASGGGWAARIHP